jgi:predicted permease
MTPRPPSLAAWLLQRSAPGYDADVMLGDLQEEFVIRAGRDGARAARAWYWRQVRQSLGANLGRRFHSQIPSSETRTMTAITQDLRLAVRALLRRPLYAAVAVLSLSIGIGLSTGVFGVLDAAVMRPLPVHQPLALRVVLEQRDKNLNHNFTYPGFDVYRHAQQSFAHVAAYSSAEAAITQASGSEMVTGELVSGDYFAALTPRMAMGRTLNEGDNVPSAPPVVVLSAFEWRRLFADAAELGGRSIKLNGVDFAVVGVSAAPFRGMEVGRDARFFAPIVHQPVLAPIGGGRSLLTLSTASWITVIGRLHDNVSDEQAVAELSAAGRPLTTTSGDRPPHFVLKDGSQGDSMLPDAVAPTLQLLLGASLIVMVVACANVAGLMLARAGDRQRELAVRAALGGGRWRLARMLFCEALVLGVLGTLAGLAVARLVAPIGASLLTQFGQPVTLDVGLNVRVLMMAAAAGLVTALLAGLAPVLRGWRSARLASLAEGGRAATSGRVARQWRRGLVVAQFALTFALVATAGLLVRTLLNLKAIPTGLDTQHVLLVDVNVDAAKFDSVRMNDYITRVVERTRAVPGVRAAAFGHVIPLGFGGSRTTISAPGYTPRPDEDTEINYNTVSPEYFDTVGIDLAAGRTFRAGLLPTTLPLEVIVNETLARQFWPGQSAVGREMYLGDPGSSPVMEVVGVARDAKYREVREERGPSFYLSVAQSSRARSGVIHVRTTGAPIDAADEIRRAIAEVDPRVPIAAMRTLAEQQSLNVNRERVTMIVGVTLGATALLLSAVGLFGAIAGLVAARTREMGVRLALGAVPGSLVRLVLRDGVVMAMAGGVLGLVLAFQLGRAVENKLFGVTPMDAASLGAAFTLLALVALVAAWLPAVRVTKVNPVEVLRDN